MSYPDELLRIISDDNNFFNYLSKGHSNKNKEIEKEKKISHIIKEDHTNANFINFTNTGTNNVVNTNVSYIVNSSRDEKDIGSNNNNLNNGGINSNKSKIHNFSLSNNPLLEDSRDITESPKLTKGYCNGPRKKTSMTRIPVRTFTDKEKREILDHYKETFQLNKRHEKNEVAGETYIHQNNQNNLNNNSILPNITKTFHSREDSKGLNSTLKSQMFKSSIYSLLLPNNKISNLNPTNTSKSSSLKENNLSVRSKSNLRKNISSNQGMFLNFNYEEFNKKIEIKNPEVKKVLEDINYYGPYFSHCPSCKNKNLEFYQTLEPHACLNILNFLKKTRKKPKYIKDENSENL